MLAFAEYLFLNQVEFEPNSGGQQYSLGLVVGRPSAVGRLTRHGSLAQVETSGQRCASTCARSPPIELTLATRRQSRLATLPSVPAGLAEPPRSCFQSPTRELHRRSSSCAVARMSPPRFERRTQPSIPRRPTIDHALLLVCPSDLVVHLVRLVAPATHWSGRPVGLVIDAVSEWPAADGAVFRWPVRGDHRVVVVVRRLRADRSWFLKETGSRPLIRK
jgi:hypothetical protein